MVQLRIYKMVQADLLLLPILDNLVHRLPVFIMLLVSVIIILEMLCYELT